MVHELTLNKKTGIFALIAAATLCQVAAAELRLSLDARQPGADPTNQWEDLSGFNNPFTAFGTPTLETNFFGDVYRFGDGGDRDYFVGDVANEDNFDFDTAIAGSADPFTVVMFLNTL